MRSLALVLIVSVFMAGCHRARVEAPFSSNRVVRERQHFFFLGLIGDSDIELRKLCTGGVSSFGEESRPSDILFAIISVGIYTPRTVIVKCAA